MLFDPKRKTKSWQTVCGADHDHSLHSPPVTEQRQGQGSPIRTNSGNPEANTTPQGAAHDHNHDHSNGLQLLTEPQSRKSQSSITSSAAAHSHDHNHDHAPSDHQHGFDMHLFNDLIGHGADYLGFLSGIFSVLLYPELAPWQKILISVGFLPLSLAMARADTRNCAHELHNDTKYPDNIHLSKTEYVQLSTNAAIEFSQTAIRVFFLVQPLIINAVGQKASEPLIQALINIPLALAASYVAASTAYCHYSVNWQNAMKKATETEAIEDTFLAVRRPNSHEGILKPYDKHTPDIWTVLALAGFFGNAAASQITFAITLINSTNLLNHSSLSVDIGSIADPSSVAGLILLFVMLVAAAISLASTYCNGVFNLNGQYDQDHYALDKPIALTIAQRCAMKSLNATFALGFSATLLLPVITFLKPQEAAIPCIVAGIALTAFGAYGTSSDIASYDRHLQIWNDSFNRKNNTYQQLDEATVSSLIEQGRGAHLTNPLLDK